MAITNCQYQYHYYFYILQYCVWTKYSTPSIRYNPSPPQFNALAPRDERNQTPNITFDNRRAETLRFGVRGFNIVRVAGIEYFVHLL